MQTYSSVLAVLARTFAAFFVVTVAACAGAYQAHAASNATAPAVPVAAVGGVTSTTPTTTMQAASSSDAVTGASSTKIAGIEFQKNDLTKPEEPTERGDVLAVFAMRPAQDFTGLNFFAYWVQQSVAAGIPANTIVLILLIPVIATIITFVRIVIGLPSLEMLVPIVLSFAFVAIGISNGLLVLATVVAASFVSRRLLRRAQIMYFAKRSLSLLLLSLFVLTALTVLISLDSSRISALSIFPVLILTLMGDSLVAVQLHKSMRETTIVTVVTIALGLVGYYLSTMVVVRDIILLYPEVILLTIIINMFVGRYFGLRLVEVFRFKTFQPYGSE